MPKSSKAEDVYLLIRDQILSGRWNAGDRLNDSELAEEFQVSRLSVREALFRLTETGIIVKEYWKGYFIEEITDEIVTNIIQIRMALESCAARNFIKDAKESDFIDMREIIERSEHLLSKKKLVEYLTTDFSFHELIYTRQRNRYITACMNNYMLAIHFVRYKSMGTDGEFIETARKSIWWHRHIFEAIRNRDEEEAVKRLVAHLNGHKEEAKKQLVNITDGQQIRNIM